MMKMAAAGYGRASSPVKRRKYRYTKSKLGTLSRVGEYDTGALCECYADTSEYPMLKATRKSRELVSFQSGQICDATVSDGRIYVLLYDSGFYLCIIDAQTQEIVDKVFVIESELFPDVEYSLVRYNEFSSVTDPINGKYKKRLLLLPEFLSVDIDEGAGYKVSSFSGVPFASVGCIFMSRLFCASGGKLFASCFNDIGGYTFDTADESLESNAWMTNTQSNTRADGDITALCVYDGHVVVFKKDYMMQIYNNKNPFRTVEIGAFGCISQRALCELDGKLAFVSESGPMIYGGGYPYSIGRELGVKDWSGSLACAFDQMLYVYVPSEQSVFVYDSKHKCWSQRDIQGVKAMFSDASGAYYTSEDTVFKLDDGDRGYFEVSTDKSSLGQSKTKQVGGVEGEILLGEGARVQILLSNEKDDRTQIDSISEPGHYFLKRRVFPKKMKYVKIIFVGNGDITLGEAALTFKTEGDGK